MKFSQENLYDGNYVTAYDAGIIVVKNNEYHSSLVISSSTVIKDWPPTNLTELKEKHFDVILEMDPELVLIGTGATLSFPEIDIYACLIEKNIGYEFMDTGAACRTYNILTGEGRNVVAGLLIM